MLLGHMLYEPAFNQLRSQEQLGYIVWAGSKKDACALGIRCLVQGDGDSVMLEERIEAFFDNYQVLFIHSFSSLQLLSFFFLESFMVFMIITSKFYVQCIIHALNGCANHFALFFQNAQFLLLNIRFFL